MITEGMAKTSHLNYIWQIQNTFGSYIKIIFLYLLWHITLFKFSFYIYSFPLFTYPNVSTQVFSCFCSRKFGEAICSRSLCYYVMAGDGFCRLLQKHLTFLQVDPDAVYDSTSLYSVTHFMNSPNLSWKGRVIIALAVDKWCSSGQGDKHYYSHFTEQVMGLN